MTKLLETIQKGVTSGPRRILVYGTDGIGKSSFAAQAPGAIFIPTEDRLGDINCDKFPVCTQYSDVQKAIADLFQESHQYETVVVDTADWLEKLIYEQVCTDVGVTDLTEIGWGKGYQKAMVLWREVIAGLAALRTVKNMMVILIAHGKIQPFNNPETEPYDRYAPALNKHSCRYLQEWCDEVLFFTYKVYTKNVDSGFNQTHAQGFGSGERVIYTEERPSWMAKNCLAMPPEIPLSWESYFDYVKKNQPITNKGGK